MDTRPPAVTIVNVVASGSLGRELDLKELCHDLEAVETQYTPESHPGLHLRFEENGPLITLYSSGSYVVMGATSRDTVRSVYDQLIQSLDGLNIVVNGSPPEVQNIICKADLDREVNLSALTVAFGMENVEYEPEQSPFLYYWPEGFDCVVSIPANGEIVTTGITEIEEAEEIFNSVRDQIDSILN